MAAELLATLRAARPRVVLDAAVWERLAAVQTTDAGPVGRLRRAILTAATAALAAPPAERVMVGRRLLHTSRAVLGRLTVLAAAHRLQPDRRFLARARAEVEAVAGFADWNPSHFLDVAEMATAVGLALDWLHEDLDAPTHARWAALLREKALEPGTTASPRPWFDSATNNWNPVCHGGLVIAALASAEHHPDLAAGVIRRAVTQLPLAMAQYEPDGAYPEGPGYWNYGTTYTVLLLEALVTALGTDCGLLAAHPGFRATGGFRASVVTPAGGWYNFSDCGLRPHPSPAALWFGLPRLTRDTTARLLDLLERGETEEERFLPLYLAWQDHPAPPGAPPPAARLPRARVWAGPSPVAVLRSSWDDPGAVFAGVKGGRADQSHGQMDAGSFVIEAGGVRWSEEPHEGEYQHFEGRGHAIFSYGPEAVRWRFLRFGWRAHSLLLADDAPPAPAAAALPAGHDTTTAGEPWAAFDLTALYPGSCDTHVRRLTLRADGTVEIRDDLHGLTAGRRLAWQWITKAAATPDPADPLAAVLHRDGRSFRVACATTAAGARLELEPVPPVHPDDVPDPGYRRLVLHVPAATGPRDIAITVAGRLIADTAPCGQGAPSGSAPAGCP